jgi:hypothetical protein
MSKKNQAGKGDTPRPVRGDVYRKNYDKIFKKKTRVPIIFAVDLPICEDCGEPWCHTHEKHYADCGCIGPGNAEDEGYKIEEDKDGKLWGVK